ncbi:MAG: ABC transporter ATP-binding protein, partial [Acidobacteria bacterium]|nr:ABC transporter ATP-binding protein [Acidobacteriota bacterium]
ECFALLGPNGAGKTTTIEILEGLLEPSSGQVTILGKSWRRHARDLREKIGISLQETRLSEKLTVRETLELFASFYREPHNPEIVLEALQLNEKADALVGKLSGGQKQRLAVATALVASPKVLFLDEPTTGLDPQSRRQLWEIIRGFLEGGGTVLLTTHYMDEAERLCDRLAIVDHGQVIAEGTPSELIDKLGGHHVVEFSLGGEAKVEDSTWRLLPGVDSVRHEDGLCSLAVRAPHKTIPALLDTIEERSLELEHLTTRQASLEDVFMRLTGRHLRED